MPSVLSSVVGGTHGEWGRVAEIQKVVEVLYPRAEYTQDIEEAGLCREGFQGSFKYMSMDQLIEILWFSSTQDNVVQTAGELWRRIKAVSMGSLFDLHTVWSCKVVVDDIKCLGLFEQLLVGVVQCLCHKSTVFSLQQFRQEQPGHGVQGHQGLGHCVPPPPVSNEHCVQRTLPVRTVFFVYLINSVHN